jgi:hypothetical protein
MHCYALIPNHFPGKIEKLERGRPARAPMFFHAEAKGIPSLPGLCNAATLAAGWIAFPELSPGPFSRRPGIAV